MPQPLKRNSAQAKGNLMSYELHFEVETDQLVRVSDDTNFINLLISVDLKSNHLAKLLEALTTVMVKHDNLVPDNFTAHFNDDRTILTIKEIA